MSDSLKKRVEELERKVRELEQTPRHYPPVYDPQPRLGQGQCIVCGGYHSNLPCPRMAPTC